MSSTNNETSSGISPTAYKKFKAAAAITIMFIFTISASGIVWILNSIKQSGKYDGEGWSFYAVIFVAYFVSCLILGAGIGSCVLGCIYNHLKQNSSDDCVNNDCVNNDCVDNDYVNDDIAVTVYSAPVYDIPIYADPVYNTKLNTQLSAYTSTQPITHTPSYIYTAQSLSQMPIPLSPVYVPRYSYIDGV